MSMSRYLYILLGILAILTVFFLTTHQKPPTITGEIEKKAPSALSRVGQAPRKSIQRSKAAVEPQKEQVDSPLTLSPEPEDLPESLTLAPFIKASEEAWSADEELEAEVVGSLSDAGVSADDIDDILTALLPNIDSEEETVEEGDSFEE